MKWQRFIFHECRRHEWNIHFSLHEMELGSWSRPKFEFSFFFIICFDVKYDVTKVWWRRVMWTSFIMTLLTLQIEKLQNRKVWVPNLSFWTVLNGYAYFCKYKILHLHVNFIFYIFTSENVTYALYIIDNLLYFIDFHIIKYKMNLFFYHESWISKPLINSTFIIIYNALMCVCGWMKVWEC